MEETTKNVLDEILRALDYYSVEESEYRKITAVIHQIIESNKITDEDVVFLKERPLLLKELRDKNILPDIAWSHCNSIPDK